MKASEILPFTISMGVLSLFMHLVYGDNIFMGESIAYLTVTILVLVLWALDGRRRKEAQ